MIERDSLVMSGEMRSNMHLINKIDATILLHPVNTKRQWILKTGFWDDNGIWDDTQEWTD